MHSSHFLMVPSLFLGLATAVNLAAKTSGSGPTKTTSHVTTITTECACNTLYDQHAQPQSTQCFAVPTADPMPKNWQRRSCLCEPSELLSRTGRTAKLHCQENRNTLQSRDIIQAINKADFDVHIPGLDRQGDYTDMSPLSSSQVFPPDPEYPNMTEIYARLGQVDFHGNCEAIYSEQWEEMCLHMGTAIMSCILRWKDACIPLRTMLVDFDVIVPGLGPGSNDTDKKTSSVKDGHIETLLQESQKQVSIPEGCQGVCTSDVDTLSRAYLCLICRVISGLFHAAPAANTTTTAILN